MDSPPPMVSSPPPMHFTSAYWLAIFIPVGIGVLIVTLFCGCWDCTAAAQNNGEEFQNITPPPLPPPEDIQLVEIVIDKESWSEEVECPICLDGYEDGRERAIVATCNHRFHADCIKQWGKLNFTCPVCRLHMV